MSRRLVVVLAIGRGAIAGAWLLFVGLPRWYARRRSPAPRRAGRAGRPPSARSPRRSTTSSEDGLSLVGVQREVPFGEPIAEQARRIVEAQLAAAAAAARLAGSRRHDRCARCSSAERGRGVRRPERRRADRSIPAARSTRLFTVYTIVNALTVNLPAIKRVQILIDGKEVGYAGRPRRPAASAAEEPEVDASDGQGLMMTLEAMAARRATCGRRA